LEQKESRGDNMKQVAEIVWHEYPKEKPKNAGVLLVSFAFEDGITTDILIYSDGKWYNDAAKRYPTGLGGVNAITAFAELPAPYDPTAPQRYD
jgi:hypothetical protein